MRPQRRPLAALGAAAVLAVIVLAGCGSDDSGGSGADGDGGAAKGGPVTVQAANGKITIPSRPKRIVSLSPSATETLYAIGAGSQVAAVDDQSDHPPNAPRTRLSGFKPNAEAVIKYDPDLVVLPNDVDGVVKALEKVKIPVLLEPAAAKIEDSYDQIADLGTATGNAAKAKEVADGMRREIQRAVAAAPKARGLTYYHELTNDLHSVTSKTFIGQVYGLFGLRNVADGAGGESSGQSGGFPKLAGEYLLKADPDVIFLADTKCCGQSAATLAKRPGWKDLAAVKNKRVVPLDDDVASRWGPRLADLVKTVGAAAQKVPARE